MQKTDKDGSTSTSVTKMDEITKIFLRKIRKIEFKNVKLAPEYEEAEKTYRNLRDTLDMSNDMIIGLMNYEHGSKIYKNLKKGLQYLCDKSNLNLYRNMDIYEEASNIGERLESFKGDKKDIGEKFSEAYKGISESKKALNIRLEQIRLRLKSIRNKSQEVDRKRKQVKNMRFDFEVLLQDGGYNNEVRDAEKKNFEAASIKSLEAMQKFLAEKEIPQVLKDVSGEYKKHMDEVSELLSKI